MHTEQRYYSKKKLGSYPSLGVIVSITLALFAIGVFGALLVYSKELERVVRENVTIQVYLKNQLTKEDIDKIESTLQSRNFTLPQSTIQFISKDEAAKKFIQETGNDFKQFLGENPLRDALVVKIAEPFHNKESLTKIKTEVEKMPGVFQVDYQESLIESINKNIGKIGLIVMGLVIALLVIVVLLIHNTLRLALFSQRFLIRSMQLVGATRWFIQKPFLLRASVYGLIAGTLASGLVILLLYLATKRVEDLKLIQNNERIGFLCGSLLFIGFIVAVTSSYQAVHKYLKLSLDELY
jgi:cell division transport system permease protein